AGSRRFNPHLWPSLPPQGRLRFAQSTTLRRRTQVLNFIVKTVPHKDQRYNTVGDYYRKDGVDCLIVSEDADQVYEMAVVLHELAEWSWARDHGVTDQDIDAFDMMFEEEIKAGKHP